MEMQTRTEAHSKLELFFDTMLRKMYWCEKNLIDVLNTMSKLATTAELQQSFGTHAEQTRMHVQRLEEAFTKLGKEAEEEKCLGLQGLFDEGWQVIDETEEGTAQRDVALVIAAQKAEHYEMACYGSLATLARTLGQEEIADIFRKTLQEEKDTDALLTQIAEGSINYQASQEPVQA